MYAESVIGEPFITGTVSPGRYPVVCPLNLGECEAVKVQTRLVLWRKKASHLKSAVRYVNT